MSGAWEDLGGMAQDDSSLSPLERDVAMGFAAIRGITTSEAFEAVREAKSAVEEIRSRGAFPAWLPKDKASALIWWLRHNRL